MDLSDFLKMLRDAGVAHMVTYDSDKKCTTVRYTTTVYYEEKDIDGGNAPADK